MTLVGSPPPPKKKQTNSLAVKIQGVSYSFDVAGSAYEHQIAPTPTNVKGEVLN